MLHEKVSQHIEKQNRSYKEQTDKKRKKQLFEVRDLVWVYLRKERFPNQRFPKLQDRVDGHFQVIQKMGDNAYRLELLDEYRMSPIIKVTDLVSFVEPSDSRTSPSQPGENGATVANQSRGQAQFLCNGFSDFYQGLFVSCFGHVHEDCYSLWTCLTVQKKEGIKEA